MLSPLLNDLYQLTMAYGYWQLGMHEREAVFQIIFRKNPFKGNYAIACGLANIIEYLKEWQFSTDDLAYLATLKNSNQSPLFSEPFLQYLGSLRFTCDVDAIPEGTIVFAQEPIFRITGPLLQAQLLESTILNIINFQTLIATKASRVCLAAKETEVLEFGMRRAQGPDGALSASRAAYVGGVAATSNVLAGKLYDIPVRGTHAHSWVMAFEDEKTAFAEYAKVMPHNCLLLVDTYDTLSGVAHAIEIGQQLREQGAELLGVRLDSGDLATLSLRARQMLDDAGFEQAQIVASNSLDEYVIADLQLKNAQISVWGVGTNLATGYDQPALDGVYKLTALRDEAGAWQYKLKLSEQVEKISNPGIHQVRRYFKDENHFIDVIYDLEVGISENPSYVAIDALDESSQINDYDGYIDLLQPIFREGVLVHELETIHTLQQRAKSECKIFMKDFRDKHYPVVLEKQLSDRKIQLIKEVKLKNPPRNINTNGKDDER